MPRAIGPLALHKAMTRTSGIPYMTGEGSAF
jgi:hypothetical protein